MDDTRKADKVIFVSHQWTSFSHPDPKNQQLKALQMTIRNLLSGKNTVRTNWSLEMGYGLKKVTGQKLTPPDPTHRSSPNPSPNHSPTAIPTPSASTSNQITGQKEWKELLEDGYIWFDYLSIPQPLAAKQEQTPTVPEAYQPNPTNRTLSPTLTPSRRRRGAWRSSRSQRTRRSSR